MSVFTLFVLLMTITGMQLNAIGWLVWMPLFVIPMRHFQICHTVFVSIWKWHYSVKSSAASNTNEIFVFNLFPRCQMHQATNHFRSNIHYIFLPVSWFAAHRMHFSLCLSITVCMCLWFSERCIKWAHLIDMLWSGTLKHSTAPIYVNTVWQRFVHFMKTKLLMNTCASDDSLQFSCISVWINNRHSNRCNAIAMVLHSNIAHHSNCWNFELSKRNRSSTM